MPQIDVKITDLDPVPKLRNDDLFLIANPMVDVDGNPIVNYPYTSNSISGGGLSSTIKETITNENTIICAEWDYDIKIKIDDPFFGDMVNNLCSANDIENEYGYKPSNPTLISSSSTINGDTIVNKDYVDQLTKLLYQNIISNLISGFTTIYGNNNILQSQKGQIIHSTFLSALESYTNNGITVTESSLGRKDAMVRYYFGNGRTIANFGGFELKSPDTKWRLHGPYFLRGVKLEDDPNSKVKQNDRSTSSPWGGGADEVKMTSNMLIEHNHNISDTNLKMSVSSKFSNGSITGTASIAGNSADAHQAGHPGTTSAEPNAGKSTLPVTGSCSGDVTSWLNFNQNGQSRTDNTGESNENITPIPTVPVYKNVFIWERIN